MIQAKGYDFATAEKLARFAFEESKGNKNGMTVEWYINRILPKEEYDRHYRL